MKTNLISRLLKPRLLPRIWKQLLSFFFFEQWAIMVALAKEGEIPALDAFKPLLPPRDRFWADPFIWAHEDQYFVFIEELLYSNKRGRIACLTLDKQLNIISNQVVLERPYHLSYPFLFEYGKQLYMLPETEKNRAVELYCCTRFPDHWEFEKTLIPDIRAVDATLLEAHGKWWLFANIIEEGGTGWDALYLYYADQPLSDRWTPHPLNPVVKDIRSARPAGRILSRNGNLIRPSQDCSVRYGYGINFNRIISLTEKDYQEIKGQTVKPPQIGKMLATHTWSEAGELKAIDAIIHRWKI